MYEGGKNGSLRVKRDFVEDLFIAFYKNSLFNNFILIYILLIIK